jgi:hypothetical protein
MHGQAGPHACQDSMQLDLGPREHRLLGIFHAGTRISRILAVDLLICPTAVGQSRKQMDQPPDLQDPTSRKLNLRSMRIQIQSLVGLKWHQLP